MLSESEYKEQLESQGYTTVFSWRAEPGEEDFEHVHRGESAQIILEGTITIVSNGTEHILEAGMRGAIPARTVHSAVVGPDGCYYIFALK